MSPGDAIQTDLSWQGLDALSQVPVYGADQGQEAAGIPVCPHLQYASPCPSLQSSCSIQPNKQQLLLTTSWEVNKFIGLHCHLCDALASLLCSD